MSDKIEDGGPAFPQCGVPPIFSLTRGDAPDDFKSGPGEMLPVAPGKIEIIGQGLSIRDWFAGQALAGWLATYGDVVSHPAATGDQEQAAFLSYKIADAMLAERSKKKGEP